MFIFHTGGFSSLPNGWGGRGSTPLDLGHRADGGVGCFGGGLFKTGSILTANHFAWSFSSLGILNLYGNSRPNLVNEAEGYSPGFPALLSYSLGRKPPISKQMLTPTYSIAAKYRNMAARRIVWNRENSASLCLPRRNRINTIKFFQKAKNICVKKLPAFELSHFIQRHKTPSRE